MHWLRLLLEAWISCGIVTVIFGLFWTSRQSNQLSKQAANTISPPKRRTELRPANLSEVRSI
jgi:hypothetical protein